LPTAELKAVSNRYKTTSFSSNYDKRNPLSLEAAFASRLRFVQLL
jgi:hypothetical protein